MLSDLYTQTENMYDLKAAISKVELVVSVIPEEHPD